MNEWINWMNKWVDEWHIKTVSSPVLHHILSENIQLSLKKITAIGKKCRSQVKVTWIQQQMYSNIISDLINFKKYYLLPSKQEITLGRRINVHNTGFVGVQLYTGTNNRA